MNILRSIGFVAVMGLVGLGGIEIVGRAAVPGFQGVIAEIRKKHPGVRLHTLHGTDFGGMYVRQICDECGWIYPWRIMRRDKISATAIRRGAKGMTPPVVTDVLQQISQNLPEVTAGGRRFRNDNGVLTEGV